MAKRSGAIILIPARMGSTRLPGKPLRLIDGEALIVHVWRRACRAAMADVAVVCQEEEIAQAIRDVGGRAEVEAVDHSSGTDRIGAALDRMDPEGEWDPVINLQGDMPVFDPGVLAGLIDVLDHSGADMATPAFEMGDWQRRCSPSVVKVDVAWNGDSGKRGRAIDFSRRPFAPRGGRDYHHVGIYAYRRRALARFIDLGPSRREEKEHLEQLRALDAGMTIAVHRVDPCEGGIDTLEDLERLRRGFDDS